MSSLNRNYRWNKLYKIFLFFVVGKLFANDIPVVDIHESDKSVIFVMEKILWIRPEDIECGIVRLVEKWIFVTKRTSCRCGTVIIIIDFRFTIFMLEFKIE